MTGLPKKSMVTADYFVDFLQSEVEKLLGIEPSTLDLSSQLGAFDLGLGQPFPPGIAKIGHFTLRNALEHNHSEE